MSTPFSLIDPRARQQHGLVTRSDLREAGFTPDQIHNRAANGIIDPVARGVFRLVGSPKTDLQRVLGSCLEVGGVASHRTSAALHGLDGFRLTDPIEITVRDGHANPRSTHARLHTTTWLPPDDLVTVHAVPTFGVARTLFSLAALVPEIGVDEVTGAVEDALVQNLASERWLWWRLERLRRRGRNGVSVFESVLGARAGGRATESWLERETLRILRDAGLPLPACQARIGHKGAFVARVDFLYELARAVIEVSGYRWHRTRAQTTDDARRRRALTLAGYDVHEFTYDEIVQHPESLIATVRALLHIKAA